MMFFRITLEYNMFKNISDIADSLDIGSKLNAHKTPRTSSERLMYVQFTSCVQGGVSGS